MRTILCSAAFVAIAALSFSQAAYAHGHLESAEPPAGSTLKTAPAELDLKFSEELDATFSGLKVTGPDGKVVKTNNAMLMDGDKTFMVELPAGLAAGTYKVDWHVLSHDGHKTHGDYTFTVAP